MPTPATPSGPKSAGNNHRRPETPPAPASFEERLPLWWEKNREAAIVFCALVVLLLVGRYAWSAYSQHREEAAEQEYAAARTPEQLLTFVQDHPGHPLAAAAQLSLADRDYAAGRLDEAIASYEAAAVTLPPGPLASRAKLGAALSKLQAGRTAEGESALRLLANDSTQFKEARLEAAYQLARRAAAEGHGDEVRRYALLLLEIDPASPWTQTFRAALTGAGNS